MLGLLNKNKKKQEKFTQEIDPSATQNDGDVLNQAQMQQEERKPFSFSEILKKAGGFVKNNADLILPTAFSIGTGMGAVPGLMAGYSGRGNQATLRQKLDAESSENLAKIKAQQERDENERKWKEKQNELDRANALARASISSRGGITKQDENKYIQLKTDFENAKAKLMENGFSEEDALKEAEKEMPTESLVFINDYEQRKYNMRRYAD